MRNWKRIENWVTTAAVTLPLVVLILGIIISGPATGRWAGSFASALMLILSNGHIFLLAGLFAGLMARQWWQVPLGGFIAGFIQAAVIINASRGFWGESGLHVSEGHVYLFQIQAGLWLAYIGRQIRLIADRRDSHHDTE